MRNYQEVLYIQGDSLDKVLAQGWYRGGDHVFTTDSIYYDQNVEAGYYKVYWLRYRMSKLNLTGTMRRLIKAAKALDVQFLPFTHTPEFEELYTIYKQNVRFTGSLSLLDFLTGDFGHIGVEQLCIFDTHVLTLRHEGKLIGAGIADMGWKSMAGIANFFDPEYKKLSPGKMLVVLKLLVAQKKQMDFFYPGYIVPGVPSFDYKTFIGTDCIEVWDFDRAVWVPWDRFAWPEAGVMPF